MLYIQVKNNTNKNKKSETLNFIYLATIDFCFLHFFQTYVLFFKQKRPDITVLKKKEASKSSHEDDFTPIQS